MKKLFALLVALQAGHIANAQSLRLIATSDYRVFFNTVRSLYDTSSYDYLTGRSYNSIAGFWECDSLHQRQTTPAGTYAYTWFQTFNTNGSLAVRSKLAAPGSTSLNSKRNSFTYNSNGKLTQDLEELSSNPATSSWGSSMRKNYYYGTGGDLDSVITENYASGTWYLNARDRYTYSAPGIIATRNRYYSSYVFAGPFDPEYYTRSAYDVSGKLVKDTTWVRVNNAWQYYNTYSYQYNTNAQLSHISRSGWQYINSNFSTRAEERDFTYDANHIKTQELATALYPDSVWRNYERKTWIINANMVPDTYTQESWDGAQWAVQQWGGNTITLVPDEIIHYYYGFPTGVSEIERGSAFSIFPNPATTVFTIKLPADEHSYTSVYVRDIYGRVVIQQDLSSTGNPQIGISNLASGTYYIQLLGKTSSSAVQTISVL